MLHKLQRLPVIRSTSHHPFAVSSRANLTPSTYNANGHANVPESLHACVTGCSVKPTGNSVVAKACRIVSVLSRYSSHMISWGSKHGRGSTTRQPSALEWRGTSVMNIIASCSSKSTTLSKCRLYLPDRRPGLRASSLTRPLAPACVAHLF